jgi:hypothetical protein
MVTSGVFEFVCGTTPDALEPVLRYWAVLGFAPVADGGLSASESGALYGHASALRSLRLAHPGGQAAGGGHVRLQVWDTLRNHGLGDCAPLAVGARWMGIYTRDVLALRDAYLDGIANDAMPFRVSALVRAALTDPPARATFHERFVGLREMFVVSPDIRHAFLQRSGFDRPGFGTFASETPLPTTEGTHANIVQPPGGFGTAFYKEALGLETAPFGEAKDAGEKESTQEVLLLQPDQRFRVERLKTPGKPSGMLQVYAPHWDAEDVRDRSRPGSRGLCCYGYRVSDVDALAEKARSAGAALLGEVRRDEFSLPAVSLLAPDGNAWLFTGEP